MPPRRSHGRGGGGGGSRHPVGVWQAESWREALGSRRAAVAALLLLLAAYYYFFVHHATMTQGAEVGVEGSLHSSSSVKPLKPPVTPGGTIRPEVAAAAAAAGLRLPPVVAKQPTLQVIKLAAVLNERQRREKEGRAVQKQTQHSAARLAPTVFDLYYAANQVRAFSFNQRTPALALSLFVRCIDSHLILSLSVPCVRRRIMRCAIACLMIHSRRSSFLSR